MPINPKRVEAAARARFKRHGASWDALSEETREFMRREIAADLAAAFPELASDPPTAWLAPWDATEAMCCNAEGFTDFGHTPGTGYSREDIISEWKSAFKLMRDAHTKEQG